MSQILLIDPWFNEPGSDDKKVLQERVDQFSSLSNAEQVAIRIKYNSYQEWMTKRILDIVENTDDGQDIVKY